jgi:hypothetical protein
MENFKKGFAQIPNQLIYDNRLSVMRLKSYFVILRAYQVIIETLRNSNLRSKLGCSMNTLQNAKNELIKHGI